MLDAEIYVIKVQYKGSRYWKLRVNWIVRGVNHGANTIKIDVADLWKWKRL